MTIIIASILYFAVNSSPVRKWRKIIGKYPNYVPYRCFDCSLNVCWKVKNENPPPPPPPPWVSVEKRRDRRNRVNFYDPASSQHNNSGEGGYRGKKWIHTTTDKGFSYPHTEFGGFSYPHTEFGGFSYPHTEFGARRSRRLAVKFATN